MIVSIAVAIGANNAIGKNNQLLWHLPADLKFFKETTSGHTIIMGRKTYTSIGRPLPKRRNIVVTRNSELHIEGVELVHSVEEALALCRDEEEVFVIGGAEIYKQALPLTDKLYITEVHHDFDADTFFPDIKANEWELVAKEPHSADEKNAFDYTFTTLKRKVGPA